jgi:hypothetical protein
MAVFCHPIFNFLPYLFIPYFGRTGHWDQYQSCGSPFQDDSSLGTHSLCLVCAGILLGGLSNEGGTFFDSGVHLFDLQCLGHFLGDIL